MITANEANEYVREGKTFDFKKEKSMSKLIVDICKLIIDHINNGWLCANFKPLIKSPADRFLITKFLKNLGYEIYDDVAYWTFYRAH